jgi:hypothetical protein
MIEVFMDEQCQLCDCLLNHGKDYAKNTLEGRSHATKHHYIAERFYGRSANRPDTLREGIFTEPPYEIKEVTGHFCYECHEELLHNPILLPEDIKGFAELVLKRGLKETEKTEDKDQIGGRIMLFHEIIEAGIAVLLQKEENHATTD